MEHFKQVVRRACVRPMWQTILIALPSFALLIFTLLRPMPLLLNFFVYNLATYALVISITAGLRVRAKMRTRQVTLKSVEEKIRAHPLGEHALDDPGFRDWIPVYLSILWNVLYALVKLLAGRMLASTWLKMLGIYSLVLAVMRVLIVLPLPARWVKNPRADGWRRYMLCGGVLLVMNLVMLSMVVLTLREVGRFEYPGVLIYLMAAYAFFAIINATVRLLHAHRKDDPRMAAALAVSLTAAMVSMLALQSAMIARFGNGSAFFRRTMTVIVGGDGLLSGAVRLPVHDRQGGEDASTG